ncbi:hypothetical protein [Solimonas marina]|uniref:Tetratricopeptide repeat protein n=1 Tax=Solimonas marina TaxID=2714601 RepID=A0A970B580_9GAMM|nr:hypothetical protein [Solimonas marina]NKF21260.1 hypothetical protein [Solimonas marina]
MMLGLMLVTAPAAALEAVRAYVPDRDATVLERAAVSSPKLRALRAARTAAEAAPEDPKAAVTYARLAIELGREQADPRFYGNAEAALSAWDAIAAPPLDIAWLRAVLHQQRHAFDQARAELDALLQREPAYAPALLTRAVIHLVQGDPTAARRDCAALVGRTGALVVGSCAAAAASVSGHAQTALDTLATLDAQAPHDLPIDQRAWALSLEAEINARMEHVAAARAAFERARSAVAAAGSHDPYLDTAEADFLLDQHEPATVVARLRSRTRDNNALLRLTEAEAQLPDAASQQSAATHIRMLGERFAATRARGEATHRREEARYTLALLHRPQAALKLAAANWQVQREPLDARIFLECAVAARQPAAAAPVLTWMAQTGIEDPRLHRLAAQLQGLAS